MKVLPTFLCGGTEGQFSALAGALDPERFAVQCACLRRQGDLDNGLRDRGIPVQEYPITSFFTPGCAVQQARFTNDLAQQRIDVVHAYSFYGNVFAVPPARFARVPAVIASVRDCGPYLSAMQKRVQREICRFADCVLVNANAVKSWLVSTGYDTEHIVVIRNGVDLGRFAPRTDTGVVRAELGLPAEAPVVGVVSRLVPLKGIEQLLEAAALLSPEFPDMRVVIVGETSPDNPQYADQLRALARRLGVGDRTVFTGRRSDIPALLRTFTVSVLPSLSEGLSNVLLESMAAGVPVVATTVGDAADVVTESKTGLLVPPGDPQAIAAAVARVLRTPAFAAAMGEAGRRLIEKDFSLERMARRTEQLYLDVLASKRGRALRLSA
jgi:glycosyltransferase involved in cell wall biosynthesis